VLFWKRVATDLGIDVVTPFEIALPNGQRLAASALVKDFGRKHGTVIAGSSTLRPYYDVLRELGYGFSSKVGHSPDQYRRNEMIEVLADWGWSGPTEAKPSWLP